MKCLFLGHQTLNTRSSVSFLPSFLCFPSFLATISICCLLPLNTLSSDKHASDRLPMAKSAQRCSSDKSRRQRRRRQCVAAAAALVANVAAAAELQMLSFFFGVHGHQQLVCDSHTHTYTYTNRLNISMSHLVLVAGRRRQRLISTTLFCSLNALSFALSFLTLSGCIAT